MAMRGTRTARGPCNRLHLCRIRRQAVSAMTFPVIVQPCNGHFEATLVGAPDLRAEASSREEALAALEAAIAKRLDQGELVALEVPRRGLAGLFGKYRDDPTLRDICESAYRERHADTGE